MTAFRKGVNLGGWLSQYPQFDEEHFRTFITRKDIETIASWGFDHVRLPIDYQVLEEDAAPGKYREIGFSYIDRCLEWCRSVGLGVILDLHHAPGYTFQNTLQPETHHQNVLFDQPAMQERFIALWKAIVSRYHAVDFPIGFELLNEVVLPDSAPWNALAHRTVAALRTISPDSIILIGGNAYNAASELKNIALLDDPNVLYTFHFYEPLLFTHQRAYWMEITRSYTRTLNYPGEFIGLKEFLDQAPSYRTEFGWLLGRKIDAYLLAEFLQPVDEFIRQSGRIPYCGEYGVIQIAPAESRRRWHADLLALFREMGVGHAVWSYKEMDFGLVDIFGRPIDEDLIKILRGSPGE
ncbi:MAG: glycoside hydrolase family 5 protein [Anaerolineales bacterium]|nr:glycoside hydrolase family 5 protein [Anaerolineales bacterium]MCX7608025.1 glycoside hydrolase family 5 protein [Anaerolineales bacterium]MDW8227509.1 cellulase family glycosylhydrolase [Anaerolineales bacterium]